MGGWMTGPDVDLEVFPPPESPGRSDLCDQSVVL